MEESLRSYLDRKPNSKVCLLDNNSIEFMNRLKIKGISTVEILKQYDVVIIPYWVFIEVKDSTFRCDFIDSLRIEGIKICIIQEKEYIDLAKGEELNILKIVLASVKEFQKVYSYIRKNFIKGKELEDIIYEYNEWIDKLYVEWPIQGRYIESTQRIQKKNAGEVSMTILANILSYYYPKLQSITLITFDKDCYNCVNSSSDELTKDINFKDKQYSKISFKSNDFIIFELVSNDYCSKENIQNNIGIRDQNRIVKYNCKAEDNSIKEFKEKIDNNKFLTLIEDPSVYIIY